MNDYRVTPQNSPISAWDFVVANMARKRRGLETLNEYNPARLIGIGGKLRSGKDTLADGLVEKAGFVKLNWSKPLFDALEIINPWLDGDGDTVRFARLLWIKRGDLTETKNNPEVRRLLQAIGDALRALYGPTALTDIIRRDIEKLLSEGKSVVITGVRFPAELELIRELGGVAIWVERPGLEEGSSHITENALAAEDFDSIIVNDYSSAAGFIAAEYLNAIATGVDE